MLKITSLIIKQLFQKKMHYLLTKPKKGRVLSKDEVRSKLESRKGRRDPNDKSGLSPGDGFGKREKKEIFTARMPPR